MIHKYAIVGLFLLVWQGVDLTAASTEMTRMESVLEKDLESCPPPFSCDAPQNHGSGGGGPATAKVFKKSDFNCFGWNPDEDCAKQVHAGSTTCDTGPQAPYIYTTSSVGWYWNDEISSATTLSDCNTIRLWQHDLFTGAFRDCSPECSTLGGLNNEASSLETWG